MLFFQKGNNKQLNELLNRIQMNFENNYKDAAQMNLKEYGELLETLSASGKLKGGSRQYYEDKLHDYQERMVKFTHKDQRATW